MRRRTIYAAVLATVLTARAAAEPVTHFHTPSTVTTDGGSNLRLPPGYFFDEESYEKRDLELRLLQDDTTRLKAENTSLRKSASEPSFGWKTLTIVLGLGFVAGGACVFLK